MLARADNSDFCVTRTPNRTFATPYVSRPFRSYALSVSTNTSAASRPVPPRDSNSDHGSQFMSEDFQNEIPCLGIESSPAFVREPEGNACIERFFKTLKEQLLWVRHF